MEPELVEPCLAQFQFHLACQLGLAAHTDGQMGGWIHKNTDILFQAHQGKFLCLAGWLHILRADSVDQGLDAATALLGRLIVLQDSIGNCLGCAYFADHFHQEQMLAAKGAQGQGMVLRFLGQGRGQHDEQGRVGNADALRRMRRQRIPG